MESKDNSAHRWTPETESRKGQKPLIAVTIATYRRRQLLEQVIRAVEEQTVGRDLYEVIVCDSSSGDGTHEMITGLLAEFSNLRYVNLATNTLASKRNAGIREARADLIIFLDDDAIPTAGFVAAHLAAHKDGGVKFVCGNVRFPEAWIDESNYFRFRDSRHLGPNRPEVELADIPYPMIVVMNGSFRKHDVLDRVGLVSEEFQRYGGEDYEFGYRVKRAGMNICFAPEATVFHHEHGGSIRQYMKKLFITSRDSLPVLYRLAPGSRESAWSYLLEMPESQDTLMTRLAQKLLRLVLSSFLVDWAERILEQTDHHKWAYNSFLFRYAFAGAMLRGIRERERESRLQASGTAVRRASSSVAGWFE